MTWRFIVKHRDAKHFIVYQRSSLPCGTTKISQTSKSYWRRTAAH
jgi:hypothetical protein